MKPRTKNEHRDSRIVEICIDNNRQVVSIEAFEQYLPTIIKITVGTTTAFSQNRDILDSIINAMPYIDTIIIPKNIPSQLIPLLFPIMQIEGATYHYLDANESALEKGLYTMQMGFLPPEPLPESTLTISDGFRPFPDVKNPGTWGGDDGFKPMPGSVDDISDGFKDDPDNQPEKREMWVEDPLRMERLGYMPLAFARGETEMPAELGGGQIRPS